MTDAIRRLDGEHGDGKRNSDTNLALSSNVFDFEKSQNYGKIERSPSINRVEQKSKGSNVNFDDFIYVTKPRSTSQEPKMQPKVSVVSEQPKRDSLKIDERK
jgi:hypothetical protein